MNLFSREFSFLLVLVAIVVLLFVLYALRQAWNVYHGAPTRRPKDVSSRGLVPKPEVAGLVRELSGLGFRRLGETHLEINALPEPAPSWILVDEASTTQAELIEIGPFVGLSTYFADRAVLSTTYPNGELIRDPDLRWETAKGSVAEDVELHERNLAEFRAQHESPVRLDTMEDYLRWDAVDRELYSVRRLRGSFIRKQLLPALVAGGTPPT